MAVKPALKSGWPGVTGGIQRKVNPFLGDEGFYSCIGFHLDEAGSLSKWNGFAKYNLTQLMEAAVGAKFTGLFDYVQADGTRIPIATALQELYQFGTPMANTWNLITRADTGGARTGTVNDYYSFAMLRNILYMCQGVDGNLKFDGTIIHNMGIIAPSTAPSAGLGGAGVLTGTYSYKVTFYNSGKGHESNPSPVSIDANPSSNEILLSSIPISVDAQVDKRRLYRTATGGGVWLFLADINDNTTTIYTDNAADSTLGIAIEEAANGVPPTAIIFEVYKGFMFMIPKNSSRIHFSKQNFPNAVHVNDFRDLDPDDGDVVTGIKRLYGQIIAFKNDSIWNGIMTDRFDMQFNRQVTGIGSVNHAGILIVPDQNRLMFPSENGFYSYDGINEHYESIDIESVYRGLNQSRLKYIQGGVYKPKTVLYWVASDGAATEHDLLIMYDYIQRQWTTRPIPNTHANITAIIEDSSNNELFYIGGYGGYVWQGDSGGSDDGSAIKCEVVDRSHPRVKEGEFPVQEQEKSYYELICWFRPQSGVTVTAAYAIDDPEGTYVNIGTLDLSKARGQDRLRFSVNGVRIFLRFTNDAIGQSVVLRGWSVSFKILGRVR